MRAIATQFANVFLLRTLATDPNETVRTMVAARLPERQLLALIHDPHREVRIRVAQRLLPIHLGIMARDKDTLVRRMVAQTRRASLAQETQRHP